MKQYINYEDVDFELSKLQSLIKTMYENLGEINKQQEFDKDTYFDLMALGLGQVITVRETLGCAVKNLK